MDTQGIGGVIAFLVGWLVAQTGKLIGEMMAQKRPLSKQEIIDCYFKSGGMPSGHTTSFVAVTTFMGMQYGFLSGIFALAVATTIIIVYDSVNVRHAVGEQGKVLNKLVASSTTNKLTKKEQRELRIVEGHTVPQVVAGFALGITIGVILGLVF
ncbi:divergent PAP2 family protein [Candidatus Saccharibacteria bacterium]|nr:divergent PAP2 family protein [Candidatus Saccharibacteria bacterium]